MECEMHWDDPDNVLTQASLEQTIASVRDLGQKMSLRPTYATFDIIESVHMVDGPFEDWSRVRSPSRARRRRAKGHPQRIRIYFTPKKEAMSLPGGKIVMHPQRARELRDRIASDM